MNIPELGKQAKFISFTLMKIMLCFVILKSWLKTLDYDMIQSLEKNIVHFELDFSDEPGNEMNLKLQLHQGQSKKRRQSKTNRALIMMSTRLEGKTHRIFPLNIAMPDDIFCDIWCDLWQLVSGPST